MACKVIIHTDFVDVAKVECAVENIKKIVSQALQRNANESDTTTVEDKKFLPKMCLDKNKAEDERKV